MWERERERVGGEYEALVLVEQRKTDKVTGFKFVYTQNIASGKL